MTKTPHSLEAVRDSIRRAAQYDPMDSVPAFDPAWTLEQARQAESAFMAIRPQHRRGESPLLQWEIWRRVVNLEREFVDGVVQVLPLAMSLCMQVGLPMPDWVRKAFVGGRNRVTMLGVTSWDEVLGKPLPKGKHLGDARRRRRLLWSVWCEAIKAVERNPDAPVDEGFFEALGQKFGIGKTQAQEIYYEAVAAGGASAAAIREAVLRQRKR